MSPTAPDRRGRDAYEIYEPAGVIEPGPSRPERPRDRSLGKDLGLVLFIAVAIGAGAVSWNLAGSAARNFAASIPGPSATATRSHGPASSSSPSSSPSASASPSASVAPSASASPTATPRPARVAVNVSIEPHPKAAFISEQLKTWCAAAAVQMTFNVNGPKVDVTRAYQLRIHNLEIANTTRADSRDGGAGPLGMVATLNKLGDVRYTLRIYATRAQALRAAARAIGTTHHAAILMAWYGAHAWVMTGYRANADPRIFPDATVQGAYILDAWYPRVSSIWGRSDPPGTYQNTAEMKRNYLAWRRPEGHYPGRDGKFLVIQPVN